MRPRAATRITPWFWTLLLLSALSWLAADGALLVAGMHRATWLSLRLRGRVQPLPQVELRVNGEADPSLHMLWADQGTHTFVGVRPSDPGLSMRIAEVEVDGETVSLDEVLIPDFWQFHADSGFIEAVGAGLVGVPTPAHEIGIRLEAADGHGLVELESASQRAVVDLAAPHPQGLVTRLEAPEDQIGWVLLPPQPIDSIHIRMESAGAAVAVEAIEVHHDLTPLRWEPGQAFAGAITGLECRLVSQGGSTLLQIEPGGACELTLTGLSLNHAAWPLRLGLWLLISGVLAAMARLGAFTAGRIEARDVNRPTGESSIGAWLKLRTSKWTMPKVALTVGLLAAAFHLAAALFAPIRVTPDSVSYYRIALDLYRAKSLDAVDLYRTPGYPLFIATTMWLFGHQTQGIVLLQQLAVALLAPLTVWFLYPRTNALFAGIGGLVVGISPILTVLANHIWSEAIFAVLGTASILVFLNRGSGLWGCLAAAALAAGATMVRPNGVLFIGLMLAWLLLGWWFGWLRGLPDARVMLQAIVLAAAFVGLISPWLVSFRHRAGTWGLATAGDFTIWNNAYIQGRCPPDLLINSPYRLLFEFPSSSAYSRRDPWSLASNAERAGLPFPTPYYSEAFREGIRNDVFRYWRNVTRSLAFNMLGLRLRDDSGFVSYPDVFTYLYTSKVQEYPSRHPGIVSMEVGKPFLRMMSFRWEPPYSRARSGVLGLGEMAYRGWGVVSVLGILAGFLLMHIRKLRAALLICVCAAATILSPSVIGMPIDRYVMVIEPLFYVAIVMAAYASSCLTFGSRQLRRTPPCGLRDGAAEDGREPGLRQTDDPGG